MRQCIHIKLHIARIIVAIQTFLGRCKAYVLESNYYTWMNVTNEEDMVCILCQDSKLNITNPIKVFKKYQNCWCKLIYMSQVSSNSQNFGCCLLRKVWTFVFVTVLYWYQWTTHSEKLTLISALLETERFPSISMNKTRLCKSKKPKPRNYSQVVFGLIITRNVHWLSFIYHYRFMYILGFLQRF